jgi:hypothetical protein
LRNGNLDPPTVAPQAARQPVVLAQSVEHRTTHALRRVDFELRPHAGLETANRVKQAEHAVLNQIVQLHAGRQASHQMTGDAPDQRSKALDELILVELTSSVIHASWKRYQA